MRDMTQLAILGSDIVPCITPFTGAEVVNIIAEEERDWISLEPGV